MTATSRTGGRSLGCAAIARAMAESPRGTAATSKAWLLIEHPGPWPRDALSSGFSDDVVDELFRRAEQLDIRVTAIRRRPAGYAVPERNVFIARSERDGTWMEQLVVRDPAEVLDLDLQVTARPAAPGVGRELRQPLYLVCTHGRNDACCAEFGRPVVRALQASGSPVPAERVWEASHVGGDRFAANLVALPLGIYYGHLDARSAVHVVAEHEQGRIVSAHYRGRCCDEPIAQIADHVVRTHFRVTGIDDVSPRETSVEAGIDKRWIVHVRCGHRDVAVRLAPNPEPPRLTSCTAGEHGEPDHCRVLELQPSSPNHDPR